MQTRKTDITATEVVANAALAKAGGVMTGEIDLLTARTARSDIGNSGSALVLNIDAVQVFTATVDQATTMSFSGAVLGGDFAFGVILRLTNGGAFTITWPSSIRWAGGNPPVFTTSGVDILAMMTFNEGGDWYTNVTLDVK